MKLLTLKAGSQQRNKQKRDKWVTMRRAKVRYLESREKTGTDGTEAAFKEIMAKNCPHTWELHPPREALPSPRPWKREHGVAC